MTLNGDRCQRWWALMWFLPGAIAYRLFALVPHGRASSRRRLQRLRNPANAIFDGDYRLDVRLEGDGEAANGAKPGQFLRGHERGTYGDRYPWFVDITNFVRVDASTVFVEGVVT